MSLIDIVILKQDYIGKFGLSINVIWGMILTRLQWNGWIVDRQPLTMPAWQELLLGLLMLLPVQETDLQSISAEYINQTKLQEQLVNFEVQIFLDKSSN